MSDLTTDLNRTLPSGTISTSGSSPAAPTETASAGLIPFDAQLAKMLGNVPGAAVGSTVSTSLAPFRAELATDAGPTAKAPLLPTCAISPPSLDLSKFGSSSQLMATRSTQRLAMMTPRAQSLAGTSLKAAAMVPTSQGAGAVASLSSGSRASSHSALVIQAAVPTSGAPAEAADLVPDSTSDKDIAASVPTRTRTRRSTGEMRDTTSDDRSSGSVVNAAEQGPPMVMLASDPTPILAPDVSKASVGAALGDASDGALAPGRIATEVQISQVSDASSDPTQERQDSPQVATPDAPNPGRSEAQATAATPAPAVAQATALSALPGPDEPAGLDPNVPASAPAASQGTTPLQASQSRRHGQNDTTRLLPAVGEVVATRLDSTASPSAPAPELSTPAGAAIEDPAAIASFVPDAVGRSAAAAEMPAQTSVRMLDGAQVTSAPAQVGASLVTLTSQPDGSSRLALSLQPKELGSVQIQLDRDPDGAVKIVIAASEPATLRSLMTNEAHLHAVLDAASVPAGNRHLTFELSSASPAAATVVTPGHTSAGSAFEHPKDTASPRSDSQPNPDTSGFRSFNQQDKGQTQDDRSRGSGQRRNDINDDIGQTGMSGVLLVPALPGAGRAVRSGSINITA